MALTGEFISKNKIVLGVGVLLMVGCACAAQAENNSAPAPVRKVQTQPPRFPDGATEAHDRRGIRTPAGVESPRDKVNRGTQSDARVRPERAKSPQGAGDPNTGLDDVTP